MTKHAATPLLAAGLFACGQVQPPPPPVVIAAASSSVAPPPSVPQPPPTPPAPPPFVPAAPFSVVARAGGEDDITVFPLDDGGAVLAAVRAGDRKGSLRLAVLDHDAFAPAPTLTSGLPGAVFTDPELPLVAGRWPDALWLTRGERCEAHAWQSAAGRWEPRPAATAPTGKCAHLAAWTPGAAVAVFDGRQGPAFAVFGRAPRALPAMPPRRRGQPDTCGSVLGGVGDLFAFPTGEVVVSARGCGEQRSWLARWSAGATRGELVDAEVDPNYPYLVRRLSRDEVAVDGGGVIRPEEGGVSVEVRFQFTRGRFQRASKVEHEINALETWMVQAHEILHLPPGDPIDGFRYDGFQLGLNEEVFVTGHLMAGGKPAAALLLRNRPVREAVTFP